MDGYRSFMKRIYGLLFALVALTSSGHAQAHWNQVASFRTEWDSHKQVQFSLSIPNDWDAGGDFSKVVISVPGKKDFTLITDEGWVRYASEMASISPSLSKRSNLFNSDYMLAANVAQGKTFVFLFGYTYASSPGALDVLELLPSGEPFRVLHIENFLTEDLRDLDGDGTAEIIGLPCSTEEWGNGLETYSPFNVYSIAKSSRAVLSLQLSRKYTLDHYYGWAGAQCTDKFSVVMHPPGGGKPLVVTTPKAEALTSKP